MTELDGRKIELLETIVRDYIKTARPVASARLVEEYRLPMSSATVRQAMLELDRLEYLEQPHHAAGRLPTRNAYRFFVDRLTDGDGDENIPEEFFKQLERAQDVFAMAVRIIAQKTQNVGLAGSFAQPGSFRFFGLSELFHQPEFIDTEAGVEFVSALEYILTDEHALRHLVDDVHASRPRVLIGKENPLKVLRDWSIIVAPVNDEESGVVAVIGPQRMSYEENIALIAGLARRIEEMY
ncbi:MAG: hypothetical protein U1A16_03605 [Patescibacteria group bacterium]|nr:hypothetical protein [Patescibacteria group bacterium]